MTQIFLFQSTFWESGCPNRLQYMQLARLFLVCSIVPLCWNHIVSSIYQNNFFLSFVSIRALLDRLKTWGQKEESKCQFLFFGVVKVTENYWHFSMQIKIEKENLQARRGVKFISYHIESHRSPLLPPSSEGILGEVTVLMCFQLSTYWRKWVNLSIQVRNFNFRSRFSGTDWF